MRLSDRLAVSGVERFIIRNADEARTVVREHNLPRQISQPEAENVALADGVRSEVLQSRAFSRADAKTEWAAREQRLDRCPGDEDRFDRPWARPLWSVRR